MSYPIGISPVGENRPPKADKENQMADTTFVAKGPGLVRKVGGMGWTIDYYGPDPYGRDSFIPRCSSEWHRTPEGVQLFAKHFSATALRNIEGEAVGSWFLEPVKDHGLTPPA